MNKPHIKLTRQCASPTAGCAYSASAHCEIMDGAKRAGCSNFSQNFIRYYSKIL